MTSPAAAVHWHADDGKGVGDAVLSPSVANSWRADWSLGTVGNGSEVLDGTYQMIAQAFDDRGIAGDAKLASIVLNRRRPYAPPIADRRLQLALGPAGPDRRPRVDAELRARHRRLSRLLDRASTASSAAASTSAPARARRRRTSLLSTTTTSCSHFLPLVTGLTKYSVVAVDRDSTGALREGDERSFWVSAAGTAPGCTRRPARGLDRRRRTRDAQLDRAGDPAARSSTASIATGPTAAIASTAPPGPS